MPSRIKVVEVGPRDGFQNTREFIPTETKVAAVLKLLEAGFEEIEVTSFVSPKAVPQMADSREVFLAVKDRARQAGVSLISLVPNARGAEIALELGLDAVNFVISVSETHNLRNVRRTREESFAELTGIASAFASSRDAPRLILSLSTAFGCPFEGVPPTSSVVEMLARGMELGIRRFILADTMGSASPSQVKRTLEVVFSSLGDGGIELGLHLHDTYGRGLVNAYASLDYPVAFLESSFGGLGGCPFAPGALGNVATEDLVDMLETSGVKTGIDLSKVLEASTIVESSLPGSVVSRVWRARCGYASRYRGD